MTNNSVPSENENQPGTLAWKKIVAKYQKPAVARSAWQIANTLVPYALLWVLAYLALSVSWWLTLPLAILMGGFMVRIFIIHHDCGHGSFFKSRSSNDLWGFGGNTPCITLLPVTSTGAVSATSGH